MTEESTTTKPAAWTCANCGATRPAEPHATWCATGDAEPRKAERRYAATLYAMDPAELPFGQGIQITVHARSTAGAIAVTLEATDPELLLRFLRDNWGTEAETGTDWRSEIGEVLA